MKLRQPAAVPDSQEPMNPHTRHSRFLLAALFCVSGALLQAEDKDKGPAEVPPSVLKRYDKNKNGVLDDAERAKWEADNAARREKARSEREAMLQKYDTNKDGKLSEEEKVSFKLGREKERSEQEAERMKERAAKLKAEREAKETAEKTARETAEKASEQGKTANEAKSSEAAESSGGAGQNTKKEKEKSGEDGMMMME